MRFVHPLWLWGAPVAVLILLGLWRLADARRREALTRFVSAHLRLELTQSISVAKRRTQRVLFLLAVVLLCTALSGPQWGFRWEKISRRGNEIVFAIDTSRSMSTPDIKPNRLTRAKLAIDDFANQLDGDAVGIVAFAGAAYLVCPMTLDYGAFHESLSAVDTNIIPRGGTNIASAIREAQTALRRRPGSDHILILVTDGEDLEGSALSAAQNAKREDGLIIYTVGVGTAAGDLIPVPPEQGGGFVKDPAGEFVKSRLDDAALKAIAAATGGFYVPLGSQGEGLEAIHKSVLGTLAKHDVASRQQKVYTERYQWPLAGSLVALLTSLLIGSRRTFRRRKTVTESTPTAAVIARIVLPLLLTLLAASGGIPRSAVAAENPTLPYNQGTAAYRAGQFPQAAQDFKKSITQQPSSDPKRLAEQEDAYYNMGNALYRDGQKTAQSSAKDTLQKWNDAVKAYETALQLRADDADSKYNRDLVKRKIAELQQNQNQNQNKNDKNQNNQKQNSDKDSKNNQGQGQDDKQNSSQPQGQPPDPNQGQGNTPQNAKNNDQKPGNQPPPQQPPPGQAPGQPPEQKPSQPPPAAANKGPPQGQDTTGGNADQKSDDDDRASESQRQPGQMSREEARELLDSVKGDEHHAPLVPYAQRDAVNDQQPPTKNW